MTMTPREKADLFVQTLRSPDTFPIHEIMTTKMDWAYGEAEAQRQRWLDGEGERPGTVPVDDTPDYLPETPQEAARICKSLYDMGYVGVAGSLPRGGLGNVKFWFKGRTKTVRGTSITSVDYADDYVRHLAQDIRARRA